MSLDGWPSEANPVKVSLKSLHASLGSAGCEACGHVGAQARGSASGRSRATPPNHLQRVGPSGSAVVSRYSPSQPPTRGDVIR
jgi:hypothetical protein